MTATVIKMPITSKLRCSACGAAGEGSCNCGAPYVSARTLATEAVNANPQKSDRAIASEIGISWRTVGRARKRTGSNDPVEKRVGRDGIARKMPEKKPTKAQETIAALKDSGLSAREIAAEAGVSPRYVDLVKQRERGPEPEAAVTREMLPMSAQEKFDAALRQYKRKLDLEFEARVLAECQKRIEDTILPQYNKEMDEARAIIKTRKGVMSRAAYKKLLVCLHPDQVEFVKDAGLKRKYDEAFKLLTGLEIVLCSEAEMPTSSDKFPRTYAEMMARKQAVSASRKKTRGSVSRI
jgi:transcriptional regulator with XRE-family HTH domain